MQFFKAWGSCICLGVIWGIFALIPLCGSVPTAWSQPRCPEIVHADHPLSTKDFPLASSLSSAHLFATGKGVKVAVIDTGVHPHPRLGEVIAGGDVLESTDGLEDCDRHGTVVASIIAARPAPQDDPLVGVAPDAQIISIRQTSPSRGDASGNLAGMAAAIESAIDHEAQVINLSVVACLPAHLEGRIDISALERALSRAEEKNIVVIAAAGNSNQSCSPGDVVYPAHLSTVIGVSALDADHRTASYALPGQALVSSLGEVSMSISPVGDARLATGTYGSQGPQPWQGTSFATPLISGTVALLKERYPQLSAAEIREHIFNSADPATGEIEIPTTVSFLRGPTTIPHESTRYLALAEPRVIDDSSQRNTVRSIVTVLLLLMSVVVLSGVVRSIGLMGRANRQSPTSRKYKP